MEVSLLLLVFPTLPLQADPILGRKKVPSLNNVLTALNNRVHQFCPGQLGKHVNLTSAILRMYLPLIQVVWKKNKRKTNVTWYVAKTLALRHPNSINIANWFLSQGQFDFTQQSLTTTVIGGHLPLFKQGLDVLIERYLSNHSERSYKKLDTDKLAVVIAKHNRLDMLNYLVLQTLWVPNQFVPYYECIKIAAEQGYCDMFYRLNICHEVPYTVLKHDILFSKNIPAMKHTLARILKVRRTAKNIAR